MFGGLDIYLQLKFKCLREDAKARNSIEFQNQIDIFFKGAIVNNLFLKRDLPDIVFGLPSDTPEFFDSEEKLEKNKEFNLKNEVQVLKS
jgi:hypothetical protein